MKKAMIILIAFTTFAINAQQERPDRKEHRKELKDNFTPEQKAELHSKKMTLDLGLNESQQTRVKQLLLEMDKDKPKKPEDRKEMTDAEKFEAKNKMLDQRIAMKNKMKDILTEEQYAKWEKSKDHKKRRFNNNKREKKHQDR